MGLSQVPNQLGTAVLKISTGQVLEATGQLDGLEVDKTLSNIYNMMKVRMPLSFGSNKTAYNVPPVHTLHPL